MKAGARLSQITNRLGLEMQACLAAHDRNLMRDKNRFWQLLLRMSSCLCSELAICPNLVWTHLIKIEGQHGQHGLWA